MPSSEPMIATRSDARLAFGDSGGPIAFTVQNLNAAAQPVVFTTDDPAWGRLLFTATNATTEVLTLTTASVLSIYLDSLLSDDEIGNIQRATATWSGGPVKDDLGTHLAFQPTTSITLLPSESIQIEVTGALAAGLAITGYFIFNYRGFSIPDGESRVQGFRQAIPASTIPWPLQPSWQAREAYQGTKDIVYVTPWTGQAGIANSFVLRITNTQDGPIPFPANATPRIVVSFVAGTTELALCSEDQLKQVTAAVTQSDLPWTVTKDTNGPLPIFILTPDPGNLDLFSSGGVLGITFSGLVTDLAPNYASPVFVQYAGLESLYDDGYTSKLITKMPPEPAVTLFEVTGASGPVSANAVVPWGPLTATWTVFAAQSCNLQGVTTAFQPSDSYTFTPGAPFPAPVTCTLKPQIGAYEYCGAQLSFTMAAPPPVQISSFFATSEWPDPVSGSDINVSWCTVNATACQVLRLDTDSVIGTAPCGNWSVPASGAIPTHFRIIATGPASTAQQDIQISSQIIDHTRAQWTMTPGDVTQQQPVAADGDPPRCFITVGIEMSDSGYKLILRWTTARATSCFLYEDLDDFMQIGEGLSGQWSKQLQSGQTAMNILAVMIGQQASMAGQQIPFTVTIG